MLDTYEESGVADLPLWADEDANAVLQAVCAKHKVPVHVITDLVGLQRERQHHHPIGARSEASTSAVRNVASLPPTIRQFVQYTPTHGLIPIVLPTLQALGVSSLFKK